jgi:signal transduction histidine kinase
MSSTYYCFSTLGAPIMPTLQNLELSPIRPMRLFMLTLIAIFTIELVVMFVLPYLVPTENSVLIGGFIDACLLTFVLSPMVWLGIVKPMQKLAATRQRLLAKVLSAQELERRRIARELHDGLGQTLTTLTVGLRAIEESISDLSIQTHVRQLRRVGSQAHEEVRRLARGLRPAVLDDIGLIPAVECLLADLSEAHEIEASATSTCDETRRFSEEVETAVYRIVQEAATNAISHGHAKQFRVSFECSPTTLRVDIRDNGCGFDSKSSADSKQSGNAFGLLSMQERVCLLHGRVDIDSGPDAGTRIQIQIPIR